MSLMTAERRDARTAAILDAAERCFARAGFHGTSVQEIAAAANMSAGNLYRYFPSKEALIAGLCERHLAQMSDNMTRLNQAREEDFWTEAEAVAQQELSPETRHERLLWLEVITESARSDDIAAISLNAQCSVCSTLTMMFESLQQRSLIPATADITQIVAFVMTYWDGMMLRQARDPTTDMVPLIRQMFHIVQMISAPIPAAQATASACPSLPTRENPR